jgi:hypothetical protein
MHGVHAIQEWLIPADFPRDLLREPQREGATGANLRIRMGEMLRSVDSLFLSLRAEKRSVFRRMAPLDGTAEYAALFRPTQDR